MKRTITKEYDKKGKLIKEIIIEEDTKELAPVKIIEIIKEKEVSPFIPFYPIYPYYVDPQWGTGDPIPNPMYQTIC